MSAPMVLFCVPHAGASAMTYARLRAPLAAVAEVVPLELAGHGSRMREPLLTTATAHVDDLYPTVIEHLDTRPFAFFCHSLGTLIGFELLRRLEAEQGLVAAHALFSGRYTPDVAVRTPSHTLSDRQFLAMIGAIGGTDPAIFDNPELAKVFLPILRADYLVSDNYELVRPEQRLSCSVTAAAGADDTIVNVRQLRRWAEFTSSGFDYRIVAGNHFYLFDDIEMTARDITETLVATRSRERHKKFPEVTR